MNAPVKNLGIRGLVLGLIVAFAGLTGCLTRSDWNHRIGVYTYSDAVREFGSKGSTVQYPDGILVAEWLVEKGTRDEIGFGVEGTHEAPSNVGKSNSPLIPKTLDHYLRLTFGPDGKLQKWSRESH